MTEKVILDCQVGLKKVGRRILQKKSQRNLNNDNKHLFSIYSVYDIF